MKKIIFAAFLLLSAMLCSQCNTIKGIFHPDEDPKDGNTNVKCQAKVQMDRCRDTIILKKHYDSILNNNKKLERDYNNVSDEKLKLESRLTNLRIDEFLNIQDTTIFENKYLDLKEDKIPARSRDFYKLIKKIHDLNSVLAELRGLHYYQREEIKRDLEKAYGLIGSINEIADVIFSGLTKSQLEYYDRRVSLYNYYNEQFDGLK